jgi:ankyrin repeat protein
MGEMNESLYRPSPKDWASIRDLLLERGAEETLETASIAGNVTFIQNAIAIHKPESSIELREALLVAARYGQVGVVKKLVDAGVPTRIRSYSGAPLLSLAAAHPQVLKVLLDADPELLHGRLNWPAISYMGVRFPNEGATPLHFAAAYGSIESTQLLLDHGADLNAVDECGVTPFLVACSVAQKDQIELLARLGAVVHPKRAWEMLGSISGGRQQEAEAGLQLEKLGIAKPT